MEILNILYNNSNIAFYLIGAILVVILIFIVISSMYTTPNEEKKEEKILKDPTEDDIKQNVNIIKEENEEKKDIKEDVTKDIPRINDIVENLYQKSLENKVELEETQDLNSFLQEFEVPNNVIEEVVNNDVTDKTDDFKEEVSIEIPLLKEQTEEIKEFKDPTEKQENIENMLKRLYDLRQDENNARKSALLNEIYDLKKQVDETLKSNIYDYSLNYNEVDTKALADYYLFNEDIEFPKLK